MALVDPIMVFSGPKSRRREVLNALKQDGFLTPEGDPTHSHGLPDVVAKADLMPKEEGPEGSEAAYYGAAAEDSNVAWITIIGDQINDAQAIVEQYSWTLRMHQHAYELIETPNLLTKEQVQQMIEQALKGR